MADSKRKGAKRKDTNLKEDSIPDVTHEVSRLSLGTDQQEKDKGDGNEQYCNQTPEQNWARQGARPKTDARPSSVSRQLDYNSTESNKKTDNDKDEKRIEERKDGNWLEKHKWKGEKPNHEKRMDDTVNVSSVYPVAGKWCKGKEVDLQKIYLNLPEFIKEMRVPSLRQEVQAQHKSPKAIDFTNKSTPYLQEIKDEVQPPFKTDKPSLRKGDNSFKAYSLQPLEENYWYFQLEFFCQRILKMHLPTSSDPLQWSDWFDVSDKKGKFITAVCPSKKDKRWIFISSSQRAKIALLDWPPDDIITPKNTIRILVVQPSEFKEYVKYCGDKFPIISLPPDCAQTQDEIRVKGYLSFWIKKIARFLKLQFIWMIDDSVEYFYEYHPTQPPPNCRPSMFGQVFQQIEELATKKREESPPFVAMSPMGFSKPFNTAAVFHNIPTMKSKNVYYRPELHLPKGDKSFKAFTLRQWFLDCEYMLTMNLPDDSLQWFDVSDHEGRCIRAVNPWKKYKRWIFIPSFRRAQIALLDWPPDETVTKETTIRILVVRPSEFKEYVQYCGHKFPIICLPQDEIGAGYPRFWIQKIAMSLNLQYIWMIDDSVECFYEYHPDISPPNGSYKEHRRRKFGLVFKRIEDFVKKTENNDKPIAAMSPRRWNGKCKPKQPFVCKPPQCAVFLNLRALSEKNVRYRPELKTLEDMIFGYECEKKGLEVYMDNLVQLQDHKWENSGASSHHLMV